MRRSSVGAASVTHLEDDVFEVAPGGGGGESGHSSLTPSHNSRNSSAAPSIHITQQLGNTNLAFDAHGRVMFILYFKKLFIILLALLL